MFGLTQYKVSVNTALALTGVSIAPVVGAFKSLQESKSSTTQPTLNSPAASNDWTEWVLSGHLGNFLSWTGKQLADIGRDVFPAPSNAERLQTMRADEEILKQLLSEKNLGEDVDADISEALNSYLRTGRYLIKERSLDPTEWQEALNSLQSFAEMIGNENTVKILGEWLEQLDLLLAKQNSDKQKQAADLNSPEDISIRQNYGREKRTNTLEASSIIQKSKREPLGYSGLISVPFVESRSDSTLDMGSLGNAGFTITGGGISGFGWSASGAGDVNGDGVADVIISNTSGEKISVIFGSGSGLSGAIVDATNLGSAGFTITGASTYAGRSVSDAGDVNHDGIDDIIIGDYALGKSYVVFGATSGLAGTNIYLANLGNAGFTITRQPWDRFGFSVSGAGDVNGDGIDDIVASSYYGMSANGRTGVVYVVFGSSSGLPGTNIDVNNLGSAGFKINGAYSGDYAGTSVSGAGDVNGDGINDIIIGAYGANPDGRRASLCDFWSKQWFTRNSHQFR